MHLSSSPRSGILGSACAIVAFGALDYVKDTTLFIVFCFLVRICEALGSCAFSTVSYIYIMNEFSNVVGWAFGLLETFVGLGMSLGPGNYTLVRFVLFTTNESSANFKSFHKKNTFLTDQALAVVCTGSVATRCHSTCSV